jgi:hypothetical protein
MKSIDVYTYCGMGSYKLSRNSDMIITVPIANKYYKQLLSQTDETLFKFYICSNVVDQCMLHFRDDVKCITDQGFKINDDYTSDHNVGSNLSPQETYKIFTNNDIRIMTTVCKFILSLRRRKLHDMIIVDVDYKSNLHDYEEIVGVYIDAKNNNQELCSQYMSRCRKYVRSRNELLNACIMEPLSECDQWISNFNKLII